MRTVVKSGEVYHLWAYQTQEYARCGNQSFRGVEALSYNATIARLVKVKDQWVALHTTQTWSITTSGHQSECKGASRHLASFTVPDLGERGKVNHKANLKYFAGAIEDAANKAARARTSYPVDYLESLVVKANLYAETFGLATRFEAPAIDRAALKARIAKKLEADKARNAKYEREREAAQVRLAAEFQEKLGDWLAGGSVRLPYHTSGAAYLRLEDDEVVTTQGARVPVEHVRKVLPVVLGLLRTGRTYEANGHTIHLGHYSLDRITEDGTVIAGCHQFAKAEVERFAAILEAQVST